MTLHSPKVFPLLTLLLVFAQPACHAQQVDAGANDSTQRAYPSSGSDHPHAGYVGRFDVYAGFSNINAPFVNNLNQPGFGLQVGMVHNTWLATGFDYSNESGTTNLTPSLLPTNLQQALGAGLPPGYSLSIPANINIQTFAAGPQLTFRHFPAATLLLHPALSAFRIAGTPHATDPIGGLVASMLVPQGTKVDWVGAYGVGGGAELRVSRHLSARVQADFAWCHPFNDILANGGWIYRVSAGPAFHFGRNVASPRRR